MKNNIKKISVLFVMMFILFGLSSISEAAVITLNSALGTKKNPVIIDMSQKETVVSYAGVDLPFYYQIKASGSSWVGMFKIKMDEKRKVVAFTLVGGESSASSLRATPGDRGTGYQYLQSGAVLDDDRVSSTRHYPKYSIQEIQQYNAGSRKITLGNGYYNIVEDALDEGRDYEQYIFVDATNKNVGTLMAKSLTQQGDSTFKIRVDGILHTQISESETPTIVYAFNGISKEYLEQQEPNWVEKMISKIGIAIGDAFMALFKGISGGYVSIDAIVFNQYKPTIANFFGTEGGGTGLYTAPMQTIINYWFRVFLQFVKVVMLILLVVMGIRAMLVAGTPKEKGVWDMLSGWVVAVFLVYFAPYLMKYMMQINDALVSTIRKQSQYSIGSGYQFLYSGDQYEIGEDSETTLLDYLIHTRGQISELADKKRAETEKKKQDSQEKVTKAKEDLAGDGANSEMRKWVNRAYTQLMSEDPNVGTNLSKDDVYNTIRREGKVLLYGSDDKIISTYVSIEFAMSQALNYVKNNGNIDDISVRVYLHAGSGLNNSTKISLPSSELTTGLKEYVNAQLEYEDLESQLEELDKAIEIEQKGLDLMSMMRARAGATYRFTYVIVWFYLIYQLVAILFIYYKRLITIAALIAIFPLVIMMYVLEKTMGISKPKSLSTWMTEFTLNVFIQTAHALMYVTLVESGLYVYEQDNDNWLLFVCAVAAMLPLESIVRTLIGVKGGTVSNIAATGAETTAKALAIAGVATIGAKAQDNTDKHEMKDSRREQKQARHDRNSNRRRMNRNMFAEKHKWARGAVGAIDKASDVKKNVVKLKRKAGNMARKYTRLANKPLTAIRNAAAISGVASTAIAGGGSAADYTRGVEVAKMIAGSKKASSGSTKKAKKAPQASGSGTTRAAQNAQAAANQAEGTSGTSTAQVNSTNPQQTQNGQSQEQNATQTMNRHENNKNAFKNGLKDRNMAMDNGGTNVNKTEKYNFHEE